MTMNVLKPIDIKGMKLKNRLAFGPILGMPVAPDGSVNNETMRWFEDRAKGGVGFIMSGTLEGIHPKDMPKMKAPVRMEVGASIYDDKYVPGWAKLIEMVHSYDVKMGAQLAAPGPMMGEGPSPSPYPDEDAPALGIFDLIAGGIVPVDIVSIERLEAIKGILAASAAKVKAAGFDCLELHCAHGGANLHASFLSPYYNRRTDQYGGSWENRLRFVIETIDSIRKVVGKDYPLFVRFSADELLGERGITLDASVKYIVPALEKAGVDLIDVSQGSVMHSMQGVSVSMYYPRGCFISNAEAIKKATKLPVIGVGRVFDVDMAEEVIGQGKADIIYFASQLLADPETLKKYFEGRQDEIRKCIGCKPVLCGTPCTINYESQVSRIPLTAAEKKKKVLIIGGGVGGMEAARIAALRGHKVTLMEKEKELGGMVAALSKIKLMGEFSNIVTYLSNQMKKLGIDVRLGKESTGADVLEMKPDVVIVASGASMTIPENLKGMPGVMDFIHACRNQKAIGQKVVIYGLIAAELAVSLAEEGKDVTIIGSTGVKSLGGPWVEGVRMLDLFKKLTDIPMSRETDFTRRVQNPQVFFGVTVEEITSKEVRIMDNCDDKRVFPYDTLIIARERKKINPLAGQMQGETQVFKIGDCAKLRNIKEAIWAANEVARKI